MTPTVRRMGRHRPERHDRRHDSVDLSKYPPISISGIDCGPALQESTP